ncbi:MAG: PEGA domain-containing protein [Deltaproteobacteria bacterium]|nr:PEGA domain-containing protein [Deltaproteobacteria bacterium]
MRIRVVGFLMLLVCFLDVGEASAAACTQDSDCRKKKVCHKAKCIKLSSKESIMRIDIEEWVPNAVVYIDEVPMGDIPWEGVITAGPHSIRIEAPGYESAFLEGEARSRQREVIKIRLVPSIKEPAPAQTPPATNAEDQEESRSLPGMVYVALLGSGGFGTGMWSDSKMRPTGAIFGGGALGARMVSNPLWFELGVSVLYGNRVVKDWPQWGDVDQRELHIGVLPRFLFSIIESLFYLGFEAEVGVAVSHRNWFLADLRGSMSIFVHKNIEIRVNPIGIEYMQELKGKGAIVSYNGSVGVAFRFL